MPHSFKLCEHSLCIIANFRLLLCCKSLYPRITRTPGRLDIAKMMSWTISVSLLPEFACLDSETFGGIKMAVIGSLAPKASSLWERWVVLPDDATPAERRLVSFSSKSLPTLWLMHFFYILLNAYWGVWPLAIFSAFGVVMVTAAIVLWKSQGPKLAMTIIPSPSTARPTTSICKCALVSTAVRWLPV